MSALTEFLYPAPARRTVGSIIGWWEKRRLAYNVAVGTAGVVSTGFASLFAILPPNSQWGFPPLMAFLIFGVMANVCYSFGPATEILIQKIWGDRILPTGPALYRMGLTFSVGLALFPALISMFIWFARIVLAIF